VGQFDIVIEQTGLPAALEVLSDAVAAVALDGVLGEHLRLQAIREIDVVGSLTERQAESAYPMNSLLDRLRRLTNFARDTARNA
jgi:hypothetical protein